MSAASQVAPGPAASRRRRRLAAAAVAVGVVAVLAAAAWSLAQGRDAVRVVGPDALAVPGGVVRVDSVVAAARPQHAMPGMGTDDDPVAEGMRRVSLDVTLAAEEGGELEYAVDDFTLRTGGDEAVTPHRSVLPGTLLPAGTQLSGTLVFEIPEQSTTGTLAYRGGGDLELALPAEGADPADPADPDRTPVPSHAPSDEHGPDH